MSDKLDLSLDDIIKITKKSKNTRGRGGRGGNRRGTGGVSRGGVGQARKRGFNGPRGRGGRQQQGQQFTRSGKTPNDKWDHDMYSQGKGNAFQNRGNTAPAARGGNGKLVVSNLDFGVSDSDITELFSEFGALRRSTVHYDKSGRSIGTADVHFERRADAAKALKQYNGVPLDGRVMQIKFVDGDPAGQTMNNRVGQKQNFNNSGGNRGNTRSGRGSGGGRGRGRGGGRGGGRQPKKEVSAEELDKQLDAYISNNKMEED